MEAIWRMETCSRALDGREGEGKRRLDGAMQSVIFRSSSNFREI
jgi:hypothetical protein